VKKQKVKNGMPTPSIINTLFDSPNLTLYLKKWIWANNSLYPTIINAAVPMNNLEVGRFSPLWL
jgi:hypothetical protein